MTKAEKVVKEFQKKFPKIRYVQVEREDMIFLGDAAEGGVVGIYDLPACNYYAEDPNESIWILGVHKDVREFLRGHGWYVEWYDPGTVYAFPI